ncbi:MAG TPA: response regulator [Anaerolineales bacterium]|jgi:two-component system sensor histidine kinase/response regulator|nr:response regulator [Anaerolineales bacterium]
MIDKKDIRILIVDDNRNTRKGLIALLNSFGRRQQLGHAIKIVGEATNGQEAVSLSQELTPDLIFMDINMPVMDGLEATRIIKRQEKNTKVVILSMHGNMRNTAINVGADEFVEKGAKEQAIKQVILSGILSE